jgi:hypothetical protein
VRSGLVPVIDRAHRRRTLKGGAEMNNEARDLLVSAWLRGVKQIRYRLADADGGRCAMGVLMEALGVPLTVMDVRFRTEETEAAHALVRKAYDLTREEVLDVTRRNNELGQDFLTIARKTGVADG